MASGIDPELLKKYIQPIVEKRMKEREKKKETKQEEQDTEMKDEDEEEKDTERNDGEKEGQEEEDPSKSDNADSDSKDEGEDTVSKNKDEEEDADIKNTDEEGSDSKSRDDEEDSDSKDDDSDSHDPNYDSSSSDEGDNFNNDVYSTTTTTPSMEESADDLEFFPDDRDWGEDVIPGISNRDLLIAVDSIFSITIVDGHGRNDVMNVVNKGNGMENAFDNIYKVAYVKILLTKEAVDAGFYTEDKLNENITEWGKRSEKKEEKSSLTLDKCLDFFTSPETLDDEDLWRCHHCKELRKASRQTFFWKLPPLLVIHLKRFGNGLRDKISTFVDFPVKGLDMTNRVLSNKTGEPLIYDLYAVSNHFGGLGGGHYTAYAMVDDEWYNFDDSRVSKVQDPESVKTTAAYVLFYKLRGWKTPTFEKVVDPKDTKNTETTSETEDSEDTTSETEDTEATTTSNVSAVKVVLTDKSPDAIAKTMDDDMDDDIISGDDKLKDEFKDDDSDSNMDDNESESNNDSDQDEMQQQQQQHEIQMDTIQEDNNNDSS